MLTVRTFGGLSIETADGSPAATPTTGPRRLALLAVIAAHDERGVSRDKLMAFFWAESSADRARHSLDQAFYNLRRDLGSDALFLARDQISLNPAVIGSDVAEFRSALAAGDRARAVELYVGGFLDGFYLSGALDFERWVETERALLARQVEAALESLATDASARGDRRAALEWWRRLAALDPRKTGVVVALMTELAASGDRTGALRQAEIYRTLVQDDLELDPNPAVKALAERLRHDAPPIAIPAMSPALSPHSDSNGSTDAAPSLLGALRLGDRYVIEREIGRGGSATVYLARDIQHDRRVAIKVLHPELAAGIAVERFREEITVTANLQHPHILPVHESGDADGTVYFVMPYVEGESLRARLDREHRLDVDEAVRLTGEIADALAYAHARGIVHRDIKPENILLTSGHAVVADFGLALALRMSGRPRRTFTGTVVGTPKYLSPEQASGDRSPDARSDEYSLSYMLYEMLAGETPFAATDVHELLVQRVVESPPPLRSRRADVPPHVERAIHRALASDPSARFDDISAFARALRSPATSTRRARLSEALRWRTPRAKAIWGAVALVVVLAGTAAWRITRQPPLAQRAWILPADFVNRTGDSVFDRSLDAALTVGLQQSAYVNILPRSRVAQALRRMQRPDSATPLDENLARDVAQREGAGAVLSSAIDRIDSSYILTTRLVDPVSGVTLAAESGVARRKSDVVDALGGLLTRLRRDIGESPALVRRRDLALPQATTRSLEALRKYAEGNAAYNKGQHAPALQLWLQAVELDSDFALAHASLGGEFYWENNRPSGDRYFDRALALLGRLTTREQLVVRSMAQSWRGNRQSAIELRRALLAEYPDDPEVWAAQAYDLLRMGRYAESIEAQHRRLALEPGSAAAYINLATAYKGLAARDDALVSYRRAFALQHDLLTNGNLNGEFGGLLVMMGRFDEARAAFDSMLVGNANQQALAHRSIAMLAMYRGRYAEAIEHFRAAANLHHVDRAPVSEARTRLYLAAAEAEKGWPDSVDHELRAAYGLFKSSYLEPTFLVTLGRLLATHGNLVRAREVLDSLAHRARPENPRDGADHLTLAGEIALVEGRADSAVRLLTIAYAGDSVAYRQESLARALAAANNLAAAASFYEQIAARPDRWYGWEPEPDGLTASLRAGQLYAQLGNTAQARLEYERMLKQWQNGDSDLVDLREARRLLAALPIGGRTVR